MKADATIYKDIISSVSGIHISIYLPRPSNTLYFKELIDIALLRCRKQMGESISPEDYNNIVGPIQSIANNPRIISEFNTNVAIFRNDKMLRIISLPLDIEFAVHVADTFHVKPIFAYLNTDYQYLFFAANEDKGYLYKGNKKSFELVDEFSFFQDDLEEKSPYGTTNKNFLLKSNLNLVKQKILELDNKGECTIFIAASSRKSRILRALLKNKNVYWRNVSQSFILENEDDLHIKIRNTMDIEKNVSLNILLSEFKNATIRKLSQARISYDINDISISAMKGKIKKLIIAADAFAFGRINEKTGVVNLHEYDTDHLDDDLLDDIAQKAFRSGAEVVVLPREEIPNNELITALITNNSNSLKKPQLSIDRTA